MKKETKPISIAELKRKSAERIKELYQKPAAKISLEVIISVLAIVFLAVFAIQPTLSTMSQLVKDIEDRKKTSETLSKKIQALSEANTQLMQIKSDLKLLDNAFPLTADMNGFLLRVERIASNHSIIVETLHSSKLPKNTTTAKDKSSVLPLPIQLTAKGSYIDMRNFLLELQAIDRFISVEDMSISSDTENEQIAHTQQVRVNIQGYYFGISTEVQKDNDKKGSSGEVDL